MSLKSPPLTLMTGQHSPFSPRVTGEKSSPIKKTFGPPVPILWCLDLPEQMEQVLATKLQLARRETGMGVMNIFGFGRVKVKKSDLGSQKNSGHSSSLKSLLTTAQEVSRDPQAMKQPLVMVELLMSSRRLESVRRRELVESLTLNSGRVAFLLAVMFVSV